MKDFDKIFSKYDEKSGGGCSLAEWILHMKNYIHYDDMEVRIIVGCLRDDFTTLGALTEDEIFEIAKDILVHYLLEGAIPYDTPQSIKIERDPGSTDEEYADKILEKYRKDPGYGKDSNGVWFYLEA